MNWLIRYITKYSSLEDKINLLKQKYNLSKDIIYQLTILDPTLNKSYLEWIIKQYKTNNRVLTEDKDKFLNILSIFNSKKSLIKRKGLSIDINSYSSLGELTQTLQENNIAELVSNKEKIRINEKEGQKIVYQDSIWTVISILTPEASSVLCRGTSWCVKDPKHFNEYNINPDNPLYLILKNGERYALLNKKSYQLKDIYDNNLSYDALKELKPLLEKLGDNILNYIDIRTDGFKETLREIPLEEIKSSAKLSYYYCYYINNDKLIKELEPVIATSANYSYLYARDILEDKFPLGESIIATDVLCSYAYARYVLKSRFMLGESVIKNSVYKEHYERHFNVKL